MKESMSVISLMGRLGIEIDLPVPVVDVSPKLEPVIQTKEPVSFNTETDFSECWNERDAITEFDGGLGRADAEDLATMDLQCKTNIQAVDILHEKTNPQEKQSVVPEPVDMPSGVICPFCPSRSFTDDPEGYRCTGCTRLCWVILPSGGLVRADFANIDL